MFSNLSTNNEQVTEFLESFPSSEGEQWKDARSSPMENRQTVLLRESRGSSVWCTKSKERGPDQPSVIFIPANQTL